jgi:hypothetical protein
VWWKRAKLSGSEVHAADQCRGEELRSLLHFWEYFLPHIAGTKRSTGFSEGDFKRPGRRSRKLENNS